VKRPRSVRRCGIPLGAATNGGVGDTVTYELDGHLATITYNRPDALNAINGEMRRDLNAAFSRFRDEEEAWVAIVTGAGKAFCAGADLRDGAGSAGEFAGTFWEKPTTNSFESGWEIFKPVIAAVNGYCLGYGLTLVTWCDFVIASDRAEFGFPEVRIGVPTIVGAIRLPQRLRWHDAMELLLTGERIDARRAKEIGLVGAVVAHDQLMAEARALAERLLQGAPLAQRAVKEVATRAQQLPMLEAIRFGETMRKVAAATEDATEGGRAFAERRPPEWRGR
jgi:E-phenylitaconyl-CoA hydratase